jgi:hypothetical protein
MTHRLQEVGISFGPAWLLARIELGYRLPAEMPAESQQALSDLKSPKQAQTKHFGLRLHT